MKRKRALRTWLALISVIAVLVGGVATGVLGASSPADFDRSGLKGSGQAQVQPVVTGIRIAQVAAVPGSESKEAWALGRSTAKVRGWAGEESGGQVLFLRYTTKSGWVNMGPPLDDGRVVNPDLAALSLASNGDGWAVGAGGVLAKRSGDNWHIVKAPDGVRRTLTAVSIRNDGGRTVGFAIGDGGTVIKLSGDDWSNDSGNLTVPSGETWDLLAVGVADGDTGWIGGNDNGSTLILRRRGGSWQRVFTDSQLFDSEGARRVSGTVFISTVARSVGASREGAWIGGTIAPVEAGTSLVDPAGDSSRPFAIWVSSEGQVKTYCPVRYNVGGDGRGTRTAFCNGPLPLSGFGLVSIHSFGGADGGEALAGGLGLFHFKDGGWFREPSAVGFLSSVSFVSPTEGWLATTGSSYGISGSASSVGSLGHWTKSPAKSGVARWPQPVNDPDFLVTDPLESVAVAPDGSGRAIAVGQNGAVFHYIPEVGWDSVSRPILGSLHAVAWPTANSAWAVGSYGGIVSFDGTKWRTDPASRQLAQTSLLGVAFNGNRGFAVGGGGVILRYDGKKWQRDSQGTSLTNDDLYAVTSAGSDFVAVGGSGTVVVHRDGRWSKVGGLEGILKKGGELPTLYAAAGLSDGTVLAGGESGSLIRRSGLGGDWQVDQEGSRVPPEGTIIAVAARRTSSGLVPFVSVSYEDLKYAGDVPGAVTGFVLQGTNTGWRDLSSGTHLTAHPVFDPSLVADPVYSIALDGSKAWAVGGTGVGNDDNVGHVQAYPTSSIYRIDTGGDPNPIGHTFTPKPESDPNIINFAFFAETSCGRGLCSPTMGSGTKADVVAQQVQEEINSMSALSGGPKFVLFGGNMRRAGIPEELGEFKRYMDGFRIPVFGSMGPQDLFSGLQIVNIGDEVPYGGIVRGSVPSGPADDTFYLTTFNDRPAPWGRRPVTGFLPVKLDTADLTDRCGDSRDQPCARTHYAFDYVQSGKKLRVIVLDNSLLGRFTNSSSQNPPQDQRSWLQTVLNQARDLNIPAIVMFNAPLAEPLGGRTGSPEIADVRSVLAQAGASAVFTAYFRENAVDVINLQGAASTVPVFIFGGGGAPLEINPGRPPDPARGFYHSWQMVSVNLDPARRAQKPLGQAEVYVRSFPVVDTIAIHARNGTVIPGGTTVSFIGSGRVPDGGMSDAQQSRAAVVPFDFSTRGMCTPDIQDLDRPKCSGTGHVGAAYQFYSDDPSIGFFVRPDLHFPSLPAVDGLGRLIPDSSSGLFCAVGAGSTYINLVSGFHRARMKVTVIGGSGACAKNVKPPPLRPLSAGPTLVPPLAKAIFLPSLVPPFGELQTIALVPPPPVPIVAPAPPAAGGYAKKEEHEEATEEQSSSFTAIRTRSRYEASDSAAASSLGAVSLGLFLAVVAGGIFNTLRRKPDAARAIAGSATRRRH